MYPLGLDSYSRGGKPSDTDLRREARRTQNSKLQAVSGDVLEASTDAQHLLPPSAERKGGGVGGCTRSPASTSTPKLRLAGRPRQPSFSFSDAAMRVDAIVEGSANRLAGVNCQNLRCVEEIVCSRTDATALDVREEHHVI